MDDKHLILHPYSPSLPLVNLRTSDILPYKKFALPWILHTLETLLDFRRLCSLPLTSINEFGNKNAYHNDQDQSRECDNDKHAYPERTQETSGWGVETHAEDDKGARLLRWVGLWYGVRITKVEDVEGWSGCLEKDLFVRSLLFVGRFIDEETWYQRIQQTLLTRLTKKIWQSMQYTK